MGDVTLAAPNSQPFLFRRWCLFPTNHLISSICRLLCKANEVAQIPPVLSRGGSSGLETSKGPRKARKDAKGGFRKRLYQAVPLQGCRMISGFAASFSSIYGASRASCDVLSAKPPPVHLCNPCHSNQISCIHAKDVQSRCETESSIA